MLIGSFIGELVIILSAAARFAFAAEEELLDLVSPRVFLNGRLADELPELMDWEEWKAIFGNAGDVLTGRQSNGDEATRRRNFEETLKRVKAHNLLVDRGEVSFGSFIRSKHLTPLYGADLGLARLPCLVLSSGWWLRGAR